MSVLYVGSFIYIFLGHTESGIWTLYDLRITCINRAMHEVCSLSLYITVY